MGPKRKHRKDPGRNGGPWPEPSPPQHDPGLLWGLAGLTLVLLAWHALTLGFEHLVDDAYISFRYADNLVAGHGLVFNPGGERVEGYTNFLWVVLVGAFMSLGADPVPTAKVLGLLFCLATAVQTFRLSLFVIGRNAFALVPLTLLAVNGGFVVWASGGLGTQLFGLLTVSGILRYLRGERAADHAAAAVFLALATLARPEGALVAGVTIVHLSIRGLRSQAGGRGALLAMVAAYLAMIAPYLAFKLAYYGDLLPNTFHAKAPAGAALVADGASYVGEFFWVGLGPWVLAALVSCFVKNVREAWFVYLAAIVVGSASYVVWVGGDAYPGFRFLVPLVPLVAVMAGAGFRAAHAVLSALPGLRGAMVLPLLLGGVLAWALYDSYTPAPEGDQTVRMVPAYDAIEADRLRVADWLGKQLPEGTTLALNPAGIIPYYTGFRTIDMLGLNDAHIAHVTASTEGRVVGHLKFDADYVLDARPDLILVGAADLLNGPVALDRVVKYYRTITQAIPGDKALMLNGRLFRDYRLVAATVEPGKFLPMFLSNSSEIKVEAHPGLVAIAWEPWAGR